MHSPPSIVRADAFLPDAGQGPRRAEGKGASFAVRRVANALWPSLFERPIAEPSLSPAPSTPALVGISSSTPVLTGFSFGGGGSAGAKPLKRRSEGSSARGGEPLSIHHGRQTSDIQSDCAVRRASSVSPRRGGCGAADFGDSSSCESACTHAMERALAAALCVWVALARFAAALLAAPRWVGRRIGFGGAKRRRNGRGLHRPQPDRQSSELSMGYDDDSQCGTPTLHLSALVVPPQGERAGAGRGGRRNVYYDVEEASYRPMHRLLFMRERSINPVSQKKYDLAAAAAMGSAAAGGGEGGPRQLSDSLLGIHAHMGTAAVGAAGSPLSPSLAFGRRREGGEYALAMGDSAQVLLASPIAGIAGGDGPTADAAADGAGAAAEEGADAEERLPASEGGYFSGRYGDRVCDGTFILVSQLGSGAFSTVWLAIDVKGATSAIGPGLMFQNRMDDTSYNATAAVMKQRFAFVVLKISRSALPYRMACEKEFETHQELFLRLQREGFDVSKFLLFPLSMREEAPRSSSISNSNSSIIHSVQVGAACGPSLLSFVLHAAPSALASLEDKLWRMRFVRRFIRNAVEGLAQLHSCGILHTDVKPENLLLTLPAYEVLRKMKAEPLLRDAKGQRYRASTGAVVGSKGTATSSSGGAGAKGASAAEAGGGDGGDFSLSGLTTEEEESDRDLIFARHRLDIFNGAGAWVTLQRRHAALLATEEADVVEALGAIKVADLGNAVFVSNVRVAELQLKERHSVSERNELLLATSSTRAPHPAASGVGAGGAGAAAMGVPDPAALQQTAQYFEAAAAAHAFQTREYRAPEIIVGVQPLTRMLTPAMDVWSIGCLIFELVTGSYLFNPHAAVQQEAASGMAPHPDPEFRHNEVHLSMMQEICSPAPSPHAAANSAPTTSASASAAARNAIPDVIRAQGRMSERLLRSMLPIAPDSLTGEPLLQLILEQRTFCDPNRRGEDASFRAELSQVARLLGAIFRWDPLDRPSMADLLAMPWLSEDC